MGLVHINVEEKVKNEVKKQGFSHQGIYLRGFESIQKEKMYVAAIEELKKKLERMSALLNHYIVMTVNQEDKLKEYEGRTNVLEQKHKKGAKQR